MSGDYEVEGYGVVNPEYDQPYLRGAAFDPKVAFAFGGDPEKQEEHQKEVVKDIEGVDDFIVQPFARPGDSKYLKDKHEPGTVPYSLDDPNRSIDQEIQTLEDNIQRLKDEKKTKEDSDESDDDLSDSNSDRTGSTGSPSDLTDEKGNPKPVLTNKFNTPDSPIKPGDPTDPANPSGFNTESEETLAGKKAGETVLREQRVENLEHPRTEGDTPIVVGSEAQINIDKAKEQSEKSDDSDAIKINK